MTDNSPRFAFSSKQDSLLKTLAELPLNQPLSLELNEDSATFSLVDSTVSSAKFVMFGQLDWQKLADFLAKLPESLLQSVEIKKPTEGLTHAIVFNLTSIVEGNEKLELVQWAEQQDLELCYLTSQISLA